MGRSELILSSDRNMQVFIVLCLAASALGQWVDDSNCGTSNINNAGQCQDAYRSVIGGWEVTPNELPYQVGLYRSSGSFFCGGSLIANDVVLTAAHCTNNQAANSIEVRLGDHQRNSNSGNEVSRTPTQNIVHENYAPLAIDNDVALLVIPSVSYNNYINSVCQPGRSNGDDYAGEDGLISGWGTTSEGGATSQVLRAVCAEILTNDACKATGYNPNGITDAMICAGDIANGGVDACQGDSGGPMAVNNNGAMEVVGITSWGNGCARPNYPGVYSNVPYLKSWIDNNMP